MQQGETISINFLPGQYITIAGFVPTEVNPSGHIQDNDYYFRAVPTEILETEGKNGVHPYYRNAGGARIEIFWYETVAKGDERITIQSPSGSSRYGSHDWIGNKWTLVELKPIEITGATWALSIDPNTYAYPVCIQYIKRSRPASVRQASRQLSFGQFNRTFEVLFDTKENELPVNSLLTRSVQLQPQNPDEQIALLVEVDLTPLGFVNAVPFVPLFSAGFGVGLWLRFKLTVGFGHTKDTIIPEAGITTHEFGEYQPQTIVVHPCVVNYRYVIFQISGNNLLTRTLSTRCVRSWSRQE